MSESTSTETSRTKVMMGLAARELAANLGQIDHLNLGSRRDQWLSWKT